jgi:hypothetical protein
MLLLSPTLFLIKAETSLVEFFKDDHYISTSNDNIQSKLTGLSPIEVIFIAEEPSTLATPKALNYFIEFQDWLNTLPEVNNSFNHAEFIEEMHWAFHAEKPEYRAIPDSANLITQYLFIYGEDDIFDFVDNDYKTSRMLVNLNIHKSSKIKKVITKIENYLKENPVNFEAEVALTGFGKIFSDQDNLLIGGQVKSLIGAVVILFLFMYLCFRTVPYAFVSMIPNIIPVFLMFVIMGVFQFPLDMGTAMIASIVIGIAVDDTIHLYHNFIDNKRKGHSTEASLIRGFSGVGQAITATTFVLCFQFLTLVFSDFVPTIQFGFLCSLLLGLYLLKLLLLTILLCYL